MNTTSRIYIAGHRGLVGSALTRCLQAEGFTNLITRTHAELDLEHPQQVEAFFAGERPEYVFLAAAKVGGIHANSTYPVDFLLSNLKVQINVIEASWRHGVKGLLFLGSSCIYPRMAPQPINEEYLLTGPLEPTNEPYAVAKIAGIELCEAYNRQYGTRFLSVMPTNLYGPNDSYDLQNSHVLPALIRKFHLAKLALRGDVEAIEADESIFGPVPEPLRSKLLETASRGFPSPVSLWGTGSARREFLYSDDLAVACVLLMEKLNQVFDKPPTRQFTASNHLINIGYGEDTTIRELAEEVARIVGFDGPLDWDAAKPDGTPRKLLDSEKINRIGWTPSTTLDQGIRLAYADYLFRSKEGIHHRGD